MRDINFFRPYIDTEKRGLNKKQFVYSFSIIVSIILIIIPIFNTVKIEKMIARKKELSQVVFASEYENVQYDDMLLNLESLMEYEEFIIRIEDEIKNNDFISDLLFYTITERIPSGISFEKVIINESSINILGVSKTNTDIAQFSKNLESLNDFENVFISNISFELDRYRFSISFNIRGGQNSENDL